MLVSDFDAYFRRHAKQTTGRVARRRTCKENYVEHYRLFPLWSARTTTVEENAHTDTSTVRVLCDGEPDTVISL